MNPFSGDIVDNRLYGRGSNDMKAGVGISLFAAETLRELKVKLEGNLIVESVVDEEFGGVNGTLAGRLKGFNGDAAIIGEPTSLKVCPAQRGGHFAHITFRSPGGILIREQESVGVIDQVRHFLVALNSFAEQRRRTTHLHDLYSELSDPVPVMVTRLFTAPWGNLEPIGIPETCKLQLYWQSMPGEDPVQVEKQFRDWLEDLVQAAPEIFVEKPVVESPLRALPGSAISRKDPLVTEFVGSAGQILGAPPVVVGMEAPCDMFVFHQFGMPALLWGPKGGNTHTGDEYVEIDSLVLAARVLLSFVCRWCGVA
jgi:acetylornithine deacetylase